METNMSEISRAVLFGKLDTLLFTSLESATAFCKLRGNPYVELVHWLHQLMQPVHQLNVRVAAQLTEGSRAFQRGK